MELHPPRIACLDLDTFFVSVERLLDPSLVGREVVVGGTGWRGVVTSCSYEVRARGVRSGMPLAEARRLAPDAIYLAGTHGVYSTHSAAVRAVIDDWTPDVQAASIDEFFLDFRGCERLYGRAGEHPDETVARVVRELREAVFERTGLPASIGLASSRPLAKVASGLAKPAGVRVVPAGGEEAFVRPLPVRKWPGIGPKAEERLVAAGLTTLGQLVDLPESHRFHRVAQSVRDGVFGGPRALGADRPAFHEHDARDAPGGADGDDGREHTLSNERTFFAVLEDRARVQEVLRGLVERVCHRARRRGVTARTVTLKVRTSDFHTVTRSRTLPSATHHEPSVLRVVESLLRDAWSAELPVRLLGVGLSGLDRAGAQLSLPLGGPRPEVGAAVDQIRARFGYDALRLGATVAQRGGSAGEWRADEEQPTRRRDTAQDRSANRATS